MKPTAKELLTEALGSLAHWQRNEYVNGEWTDGSSENECSLCVLLDFQWRIDACDLCPLELIDKGCHHFRSPYNVAAYDGDKTELVAALEEAVAYCAARVLIEECTAALGRMVAGE